MKTQMIDYYEAMENFAKKQRNETQICTSQKLYHLRGGDELIEGWHDKSNGKNISVVYKTDGTYRINHLD